MHSLRFASVLSRVRSSSLLYRTPSHALLFRRRQSTDTPTKAASSSPAATAWENLPRYDLVFDCEPTYEYCPGGFHPVTIGDVLKQRYRIVHKLGHGGYSTVWLAHDGAVGGYVALKIAISSREPELVAREIETIQDLQDAKDTDDAGPGDLAALRHLVQPGRRLLPTVLDSFYIEGPNGAHACTTTAPARDNLQSAAFWKFFPLPVARAFAGGLAQAVAYMHSRGHVHGDLHLRNVLAQMPRGAADALLSVDELYEQHGPPVTNTLNRTDKQPLTPGVGADVGAPPYIVDTFYGWTLAPGKYTIADARVTLADFGESFRPGQDGKDSRGKLGRDCQTPLSVRPLEARFAPDAPLSYSADVWTLALALWDLVAKKPLLSADWVPDDEVVVQCIDVLGPLPAAWRHSDGWRAQQARYFDEGPAQRGADSILWTSLDMAFDEAAQKQRRKLGAALVADDERAAFLDLLRRMTVYDPAQRLTMAGVLQSEWMQRWALPAAAAAEAAARERDGQDVAQG